MDRTDDEFARTLVRECRREVDDELQSIHDRITENMWTPDRAEKLAEQAVTTAKIYDGNVTADKLSANSVTTVKIVDANVTTAKIADANVTKAKLATNAQQQAVQTAVSGEEEIDTQGSWVDVTGLALAITPRSTASKILLMTTLTVLGPSGYCYWRIVRGGSAIHGANTAMAYTRGEQVVNIQWLDSPASASELAYKVQLYVNNGGTPFTLKLNSSTLAVSILTALEII
jgi:hypothetical protein